MDRKRKLAMVVITVAVAMGVGHYLQGADQRDRRAAQLAQPKSITPLVAGLGDAPASSAPAQSRPASPALPVPALPVSAMERAVSAVLGPKLPAPEIVDLGALAMEDASRCIPAGARDSAELASYGGGSPLDGLRLLPPETVLAWSPGEDLALRAALSGDSVNCPISLNLLPTEGATLSLSLLAPCRASERVVIRHGGLAFTVQTSLSGALALSIPGMDQSGAVSVRFEDGFEAAAAADLPDLPIYQRFGVQWMARDSFEIHAFENGAERDAPGHVSATNPQRRLAGVPARGGVLTLLGDDSVALPMLAEVYTWPLDPVAKVEVQVEAIVTAATCGRELLAELLLSQAGRVEVTDLTMATPDCDAIGDVLVLNNPVADMKLAMTD